MTYNPPIGSQDIRVRFEPTLAQWVIEQENVRLANGATDVHDVAAMLNVGEEQWDIRYGNQEFFQAVMQAQILADDENVRVREVILSPLSPQSPAVLTTKAYLQQLTV